MRTAVELAARAAFREERRPRAGRARAALYVGVAVVAVLLTGLALSGCSRPTGPSPALDCPSSIPPRTPVDSPADEPVCHGDDCALPGAMR